MKVGSGGEGYRGDLPERGWEWEIREPGVLRGICGDPPLFATVKKPLKFEEKRRGGAERISVTGAIGWMTGRQGQRLRCRSEVFRLKIPSASK